MAGNCTEDLDPNLGLPWLKTGLQERRTRNRASGAFNAAATIWSSCKRSRQNTSDHGLLEESKKTP
jgi:hypothetical protein